MNAGQGAVIICAGARLDAPLWTNRQHVATRLAARGWKVLYVEPRLLLWRPLLFGACRTTVRWSAARRSFRPRQVAKTLWVVSQWNLVPGSRRWSWVGRVNHKLWNAWRVRRAARRLGFPQPTLLVYDTEAAEFLDDFPKARLVYDCVDDHRAHAAVGQNPRLVEREEAAIARRAAAIAVTTDLLRARFAAFHPRVSVVPNAADVHTFLQTPPAEPADLITIPHPRIGTVGALDAYKLDVTLLREVARAHGEWHFVLVGPVEYAETSARSGLAILRAAPNIHFLGLKPKEEVPAYVHAFDVAIIPYRRSPYNDASFPLKFWEFLAAGKPVVASGLPSLAPYRHLVTLAVSPAEFADGIRRALAGRGRGEEARRAEARTHHWDGRVEQIERLLVASQRST